MLSKLTAELFGHAALDFLLLRFCKHEVHSAVGAAENVHLLFKRHALHSAVEIQAAAIQVGWIAACQRSANIVNEVDRHFAASRQTACSARQATRDSSALCCRGCLRVNAASRSSPRNGSLSGPRGKVDLGKINTIGNAVLKALQALSCIRRRCRPDATINLAAQTEAVLHFNLAEPRLKLLTRINVATNVIQQTLTHFLRLTHPDRIIAIKRTRIVVRLGKLISARAERFVRTKQRFI